MDLGDSKNVYGNLRLLSLNFTLKIQGVPQFSVSGLDFVTQDSHIHFCKAQASYNIALRLVSWEHICPYPNWASSPPCIKRSRNHLLAFHQETSICQHQRPLQIETGQVLTRRSRRNNNFDLTSGSWQDAQPYSAAVVKYGYAEYILVP